VSLKTQRAVRVPCGNDEAEGTGLVGQRLAVALVRDEHAPATDRVVQLGKGEDGRVGIRRLGDDVRRECRAAQLAGRGADRAEDSDEGERRTGLLVTEENIGRLGPDELAGWQAGVPNTKT
jgi:hypothetical protein